MVCILEVQQMCWNFFLFHKSFAKLGAFNKGNIFSFNYSINQFNILAE